MVLRDRLHLALFKKIGILYQLSHLVTHNYFSKFLWNSLNLVKITMMPYSMVRVRSPDFLKKCQMQPISQIQWQIAKFNLESIRVFICICPQHWERNSCHNVKTFLLSSGFPAQIVTHIWRAKTKIFSTFAFEFFLKFWTLV